MWKGGDGGREGEGCGKGGMVGGRERDVERGGGGREGRAGQKGWRGSFQFLPTMTGNEDVTEAMKHFAELTVQAK